MFNAALLGSTGLVGSNILATLENLSSCNTVNTISRRHPSGSSSNDKKSQEDDNKTNPSKINPVISSNTNEWPTLLTQLSPIPEILFSALGTSKAKAGSIEAQRKIDLELNLSVAKSARSAGVKVYVLISSIGANPHAPFPYPKMKGELEEEVKNLGFDSVIILRPGLLLGEREVNPFFEWTARRLTGALKCVTGNIVSDYFAQEATIVARAAVAAGLKALENQPGSVTILAQSDIVKLGRTEWKSSVIS